MPTVTTQPDLIITLSKDSVRLMLSENLAEGRTGWQTMFRVESIFLEEQISQALDLALIQNPSLTDQFPCVEIILSDRPNIFLSRHYMDNGQWGEIASRYLRMRVGDTLSSDVSERDEVICYSIPTGTLKMIKEYYANAGCHHLTSILWHHFSSLQDIQKKDNVRLYLSVIDDTLVMLAEKNKKLIFSKNFLITQQSDLYYYSIACSRMLKAEENWLVDIDGENKKFDLPGDSILKIQNHISLPSIPVLMSQYKVCGS